MKNTKQVTSIVLSQKQHDLLNTELKDLRYPFLGPFPDYIENARDIVAQVLTRDQKETLARLPTIGALVVDNVPFDQSVQHGPIDPEAAERSKVSDLSEGLLTGFVAQCGVPYAIKQEGNSLISNIAAKRGKTDTHTGLGAITLDHHIENAFGRTYENDRAPAGLALIGVCAEPGRSPATPLADAREAFALLNEREREILREERFVIRSPKRWRAAGAPVERNTPVALTLGAQDAFIVATYGDMIEAWDDQAERALRSFVRAIDAVSIDVVITPGRLVLIDNRCVLHGRKGYEAAFTRQGEPYRWLQRIFWTESLDHFGEWQMGEDHMIDPTRAA